MRTFVINLDRAPERLARLARIFGELGVPFERMQAVDSRAPSGAEEQEIGVAATLTPGEIGCFMSHLRCWRAIAAGSDEWAAIFEDDIHVSADLPRFLADTKWIPPDAGLIKIETWRWRVWVGRPLRRLGDRHTLHRLRTPHLGSAGYLISRAAARRLCCEITRFDSPVDFFLFDPDARAGRWLRPLQVVPALCIQDHSLERHGPPERFLCSMIAGERDAAVTVQRDRSLRARVRRLAAKLARRMRRDSVLRVPFA